MPRMHRGEVQLYSFLTSAQDRSRWLMPFPGHFTGTKSLGTHWRTLGGS